MGTSFLVFVFLVMPNSGSRQYHSPLELSNVTLFLYMLQKSENVYNLIVYTIKWLILYFENYKQKLFPMEVEMKQFLNSLKSNKNYKNQTNRNYICYMYSSNRWDWRREKLFFVLFKERDEPYLFVKTLSIS